MTSCRKSSVIIAADDSTISWGPSPAFGELVMHLLTLIENSSSFLKTWRWRVNKLRLCCQGYGDNKPKSSTTAQEVRTLDGIYTEKVRPRPRWTPLKTSCLVWCSWWDKNKILPLSSDHLSVCRWRKRARGCYFCSFFHLMNVALSLWWLWLTTEATVDLLSCCFCRWWWVTLTRWSLPGRTLSRSRRGWKNCLNTTREQSDDDDDADYCCFFFFFQLNLRNFRPKLNYNYRL